MQVLSSSDYSNGDNSNAEGNAHNMDSSNNSSGSSSEEERRQFTSTEDEELTNSNARYVQLMLFKWTHLVGEVGLCQSTAATRSFIENKYRGRVTRRALQLLFHFNMNAIDLRLLLPDPHKSQSEQWKVFQSARYLH